MVHAATERSVRLGGLPGQTEFRNTAAVSAAGTSCRNASRSAPSTWRKRKFPLRRALIRPRRVPEQVRALSWCAFSIPSYDHRLRSFTVGLPTGGAADVADARAGPFGRSSGQPSRPRSNRGRSTPQVSHRHTASVQFGGGGAPMRARTRSPERYVATKGLPHALQISGLMLDVSIAMRRPKGFMSPWSHLDRGVVIGDVPDRRHHPSTIPARRPR
jgi:hypothetical protein